MLGLAPPRRSPPPVLTILDPPEPDPEPPEPADPVAAVCAAIIGHEVALTPLSALVAAGHTAGAIDAAEAGGWIVWWRVGASEPLATLSPWAADRLDVIIAERWRVRHEIREDVEGSAAGVRRVRRRRVLVAEESPHWHRTYRDEDGRLMPPRRPMGPPPLHTDMPANIKAPGLIADHRPGPADEAIAREEYLMEAERQEDGRLVLDPTTGKPRSKPVLILGSKVKIDRPKSKPQRKVKGKRR